MNNINRRFFLIFIFIVLSVIYADSDTAKVRLEFYSVSQNMQLYRSWWPQQNEFLKNNSFFKEYTLIKDREYEINIIKDGRLWYAYDFILKEDIIIKKDLSKRNVNITLKPFNNNSFEFLYAVENGKRILEFKKTSDNLYTGLLEWDFNRNIDIDIVGDSDYLYGPVRIKSEKNINDFDLIFDLTQKKQLKNKKTTENREEFFTFKIKGEFPEGIIIKKIRLSDNRIIETYNIEKSISILSYSPGAIYRVFYKDHEIYNFRNSGNNVSVDIFNAGSISIKGHNEDLSFRTDGIEQNIPISYSSIKGPLLFRENSNNIEIFSNGIKVHVQNITDTSIKYSYIYPGRAKVIFRIKSEESEKLYMYRNWDNKGNYIIPEEITELKKDISGVFTDIQYILPVSVEDEREIFFRIMDNKGRISRRFPLFIRNTDDIVWNIDLDIYKNRPLYNIVFSLNILPLNRWDSFFLKHNFTDIPDEFDGFIKEQLVENKEKRGFFTKEFNSHEGEKRFELWAYDRDMKDYEMIYADDFYLNESKDIVYDYDKDMELEDNELLFSIFYIICGLFFAGSVLKIIYRRYLIFVYKNMNKELFGRILDSNVNIVFADKEIIDYYEKVCGKKFIFSDNIIEDINKQINKKLFSDEIFISCEKIQSDVFKKIKEISEKENVIINVFSLFVEKHIKCVKITKKRENNTVYYVKKDGIDFALIKKYDIFPIWGMKERLENNNVLEEKEKN